MNRRHHAKKIRIASALAILLALASAVPAAAQQDDGSFDKAAEEAKVDLDAALRQLSELRDRIASEKLPRTRELTRLENELVRVRAESEEVGRTLDTRNLDLGNLRNESQARRNEKAYLTTLLDEYVRNFETRVHIAELQQYESVVDRASEALERPDLTPAQAFEAQLGLIDASLDRLDTLLGGETFDGKAVGPNGVIREVEFAVIGPVALYHAGGASVGVAEQRLGSLEPNMRPIDDPLLASEAAGIFTDGRGEMPLDPTLGNAAKVEQTRDTVWEQIQAGGVVMWPILILAAAAFLVALYKWIQLARVPRVRSRKVAALLSTLNQRDFASAGKLVQQMRGPTGDMLKAAVEHIREPRELLEEVMFEKILESRLKLQSLLSFIALAASAAPLLGLLGTVTGMINTFKLITVFGTGDAQTLSSGISEALLTTQYGLIVAIPSLLLYAFLSRKVRRMLDDMEKIAMSFVNRLAVASEPDEVPAKAAAEAAG